MHYLGQLASQRNRRAHFRILWCHPIESQPTQCLSLKWRKPYIDLLYHMLSRLHTTHIDATKVKSKAHSDQSLGSDDYSYGLYRQEVSSTTISPISYQLSILFHSEPFLVDIVQVTHSALNSWKSLHETISYRLPNLHNNRHLGPALWKLFKLESWAQYNANYAYQCVLDGKPRGPDSSIGTMRSSLYHQLRNRANSGISSNCDVIQIVLLIQANDWTFESCKMMD